MCCLSLQRNLFFRPDQRGRQQEDRLLQAAAGEHPTARTPIAGLVVAMSPHPHHGT